MQMRMNILMVLLLVFPQVYAGDNNSCIKKILDYNRKMNNIKYPAGKTTYYFAYNYSITPGNANRVTPIDTKVEILMDKSQLRYITNDVEVYQDTVDAIMICKSKQIIVRTQSSFGEEKEKRLKEMIMVRDTFFEMCDVVSCNINQSADKKILNTTLRIKEKDKDILPIETVEYRYDLKNDFIQTIIMKFQKGYEYEGIRIDYIAMDLNYKNRISQAVRSLVFKPNGKLLKQYASFRLIDNRKKQ